MTRTDDTDTTSKHEETPLASVLPALLKREGFSDVKLQGTDGVQVDANRHVLAIRCEVFDKLLCGNFHEADASIVRFVFPSNVLQAVVEYCYTNTAELLENESASASTIASLINAADFFGLDGLLQKTEVFVPTRCCNFPLPFLQATIKSTMMRSADRDTSSKQEETPLASVLPAAPLLKREGFSDVKLQGFDGVRVDANRHVLAVRSEVFDKLLCGQFQEADASIVKFDFPSGVLQAVVEYCYTDTAEILKKDSSSAKTIVSLMRAADFFGLGGLLHKTRQRAAHALSTHSDDIYLAFDFFQTCKTVGPLSTDLTSETQGIALRNIRQTILPIKDLDKDLLASIHPSVLECILKDDNMELTEYSFFLLLKAWADAPVVDTSQRHMEARPLVPLICLENIAAEDLARVVEPSGLVSTDELKEAYKSLVLCRNDCMPRPRVWTQSKTTLLSRASNGHYTSDKLDCSPMKSGIHMWKLQVECLPYNCFACSVDIILSHWNTPPNVGDHRHGWALLNSGRCFNNGIQTSEGHVRFSGGSTITMVLDLCRRNGALCASVDGGDMFEMFNNLLAVEEMSSLGLVPAVSFVNSGSVLFLGFDRTVGESGIM